MIIILVHLFKQNMGWKKIVENTVIKFYLPQTQILIKYKLKQYKI